MLCCSVLLLPRLCGGPELPRLLLGVAVGRVARDADVLLLWPRHVVRFQEIELIVKLHIKIKSHVNLIQLNLFGGIGVGGRGVNEVS